MAAAVQPLPQVPLDPRLAPCLWPDGDAAGNGVPQQLIQRIVVHCLRGQIAVPSIPFQQPLPLEKAPDPVGDAMRQLGEFLAGRCFDSVKPG